MCIILFNLLIHSNTYLLSVCYAAGTVLGTAEKEQTQIAAKCYGGRWWTHAQCSGDTKDEGNGDVYV